MFRYSITQDSFTNYSLQSIGVNSVFYEILTDQQGQIWASGLWSIFKYNEQQDKFIEVLQTIENKDSTHKFRITKNGFIENWDGQGFWITTNSGLMYYNKRTNSVINSRTHPNDSLFKNRIAAALCKSQGHRYWFIDNTTRTAIQFDADSKQIMKRVELMEYIPETNVVTTFEDNQQRLWLCNWQYEMLMIDVAHGNKITRLESRPDEPRSISATFFWDAYQEEDNTLWFGTMWGISRTNPDRDIFSAYNLHKTIPELSDQHIYKIVEDSITKNLWLATSKNGLIQFNQVNQTYRYYDLNNAIPSKNGNIPMAINRIYNFKNNMVIATYKGAWQLDRRSNTWKPYTDLPKGYEDFLCSEILSVGDSIYYHNNGREILYWNKPRKIVKRIQYSTDPDMPEKNTILSGLHWYMNKQVWFGSYLGHIAYIDDQFNIRRVKIYNNKKDNGGGIVSIDNDSKGNIYVMFKAKGLYRYNPKTKQLHFWDETDGLPGNRIHIMLVDKMDRVWLMNYNKVAVYLPNTNNFINLSIPVINKYGYNNALFRKKNGNILGTISNRIFEFDLERLLNKPTLHTPLISQLITNKQTIALPKNIHLVLQPDENTLRLFFGSTLLNDVFPYDIEYRLEGAENNWTTAGKNRYALYNNLPSGSYTFRVRLKSKNNNWQSQESSLQFSIRTPFYKNYWFYGLIILSALGFVYYFYRYRFQQQEKLLQLESKAQTLEKEKAMVMYENLKQQLNPHFLFNSLTSLNSLIQIDANEASHFLENLSKTYRYILKSRDAETVSLVDELKSADNYINLQKIRFEKGFVVNIQIDNSYDNYKIVPVTIQNLIENAIKHNIMDEDSPLVISIFIEDDYLVVHNNLQRKRFVEASNKQGLSQMQSLYNYLSIRPMKIESTEHEFIVRIPLI